MLKERVENQITTNFNRRKSKKNVIKPFNSVSNTKNS